MTTNEIRVLKDIADELRRLRTTIEKIAELRKDDNDNDKQEQDKN